MTIYTPKASDKKDNSGIPDPEVVTEPLQKKEKKRVAPAVIAIATRRRHSNLANLCVLLTALAMFATGIIGGIYLYKHLVHRTFRGWCGVRYYEYQNQRSYDHGHSAIGQTGHRRLVGEFEEHVEIDREGGKYEKLEVPEFEESKKATILHDFEKNFTAVIDSDEARCFVLPLNRTMVKPPKDFWDLLSKLRTGYYLPDAEIVREKYRVLTPPIDNLNPFGYYIWKECRRFETYRLVKEGEPFALSKRSACEFAGQQFVIGGTGMTRVPFITLQECS